MQLSFGRLITAGLFIVGMTQANASVYTFTDLGSIGFGSTLGINGSGQVAGSSLFDGYGDASATIWNNAMPTALPSLIGNYNSSANAINNAGQVVGASLTSSYQSHATIWNGTSATLLGGLGGRDSVANGINNNGLIVGSAKTRNDVDHATLWSSSGVKDLGTLSGGTTSYAMSVNDAGQIAGYSDVKIGNAETVHATIWIDGKAVDLGTLAGGNFSYGYSINAAGQVAGYSQTANYTLHATLWNGTTAFDLGTLGGSDSSAYALNNVGQAVGWSLDQNSEYRATLWNGTTATDLNSFLDASAVEAGWYLYEARGINDKGSIVGFAFNYLSGANNAFLLSTVSPVPEPEAYVMLLVGLCLVGFFARYQNQRKLTGTDFFSSSMRTSNNVNQMLHSPA